MLLAQGADLPAFNRKLKLEATAAVVAEVRAVKAGFVSRCNARIIGGVIREIGSGRLTKESGINYDVGVDRLAKPGDRIKASTALCRIHTADLVQGESATARLKTAFVISPKRPAKNALIVGITDR